MKNTVNMKMPDWRNRKTKRSVIIALDHGLLGVPEGLEDIRARVTQIVEAGPDGLIVAPGLAKALASWKLDRLPALFVTADFRASTTYPDGQRLGEVYRAIAAVEDAQRLGAVGVKAMLMFGREDLTVHADNIALVARCARECERLGLTMMIEPVFWGALVPADRQNDHALVKHAVRLAFELGADVIKAPYTGEAKSFSLMTMQTPVPIVILGGPKRATAEEVFTDVKHAILAGAKGVAFGRNVFQSPDPPGVVRRLRSIVHGDK